MLTKPHWDLTDKTISQINNLCNPRSKIRREFATHSSRTLLRGEYKIPAVLKKESRQSKSFSSRKNSFCFASSELYFAPPHCPNTWRAESQKEKCPSHFRKNHPRENQESKEHFFFLGLPSEARQWRGFRSLRIFDKIGSSEVVKTLRLIKGREG